MSVVVVGGGFWGTAIAHRLRDLTVTWLIDDNSFEGASRAAAGLVMRGWYADKTRTALRLPSWWTDEDFSAGWALLEQVGLKRVGEYFASSQHPQWRHRNDLWLLDSPQAVLDLVRPIRAHVHRIFDGGDHMTLITSEGEITTAAVVVAAGAHTDDLLAASHLPLTGVQRLPGRAYLLPMEPPHGVPHTWLGAPYRHLTWRPYGTGGRLGDTVELSPKAKLGWDRYVTAARHKMEAPSPTGEVYGVRPVLPTIVADRIAPRVWVATGGHRVGLALAGGVARHIVEEMKKELRV